MIFCTLITCRLLLSHMYCKSKKPRLYFPEVCCLSSLESLIVVAPGTYPPYLKKNHQNNLGIVSHFPKIIATWFSKINKCRTRFIPDSRVVRIFIYKKCAESMKLNKWNPSRLWSGGDLHWRSDRSWQWK